MRWTRWMLLLSVMTLLPYGMTFCDGPSASPRAETACVGAFEVGCCPQGYECHKKDTGAWFTTAQLAQVDRKLILLQDQVATLELKKQRRFGWTLGCGGLVGPELNSGQTGITGAAGCGALWGFRF